MPPRARLSEKRDDSDDEASGSYERRQDAYRDGKTITSVKHDSLPLREQRCGRRRVDNRPLSYLL
jgi:hypothetical protein